MPRKAGRHLLGHEQEPARADAGASIIWRASPDGMMLDAWGWNDRAGEQEAEYFGRGWLQALHPDDRERIAREWAEAISLGRPGSLEFRMRRPDGAYRWMRCLGVPLRDATGAIAEWVGTITDVQERNLSEQVLREREELLSLAVSATGLGIWDMELPSRWTEWSLPLKALAGLRPDAVIGEDLFYGLVHPEDRAAVQAAFDEAVASKTRNPYSIVYRIHRADTGEERWWHEWARLVADASGSPARLVGAVQDVTDRKNAEIERQNSEKRWQLALRAARMVAWEHAFESGLTISSDNSRDLFGLEAGNLPELLERVHPADRSALASLFRHPSPDRTSTIEFRYRHADGRELWLEASVTLIAGDGRRSRIVGVTSDITDRKAAQEELLRAANHDALTGLPNRAALQTALDRSIGLARADGTRVTMFLLDVDHFKDINDTLGHDAGDALLRCAAERLRSVTGSSGVLARLGGDEFAVLATSLLTKLDQERLAEALLHELRKGFVYQGKNRRIMASIGIATFPDDAADSVDLLKCADLALYAAKGRGRARLNRFTPEMRHDAEERATMLHEVQRALAENEFAPFYQLKIDLETGRTVGFEALARWMHPERGILSPQVFGKALEDSDLSVAIDEIMLSQVIDDMAAWLGRGLRFGRVALNLSSFAFAAPDLADKILARLAERNVPSSAFEVEITETVLLDDRARSVSGTLQRLHQEGVKVSLDDFGTGYASLIHLKRFPVDELKIDRSFIQNLESSTDDAAIVAALTGLAKNLDLTVVAEGVENRGQLAKLRSFGCHYGQGFLFAKPMAASRVPWLLAQGHAREKAWPVKWVRARKAL